MINTLLILLNLLITFISIAFSALGNPYIVSGLGIFIIAVNTNKGIEYIKNIVVYLIELVNLIIILLIQFIRLITYLIKQYYSEINYALQAIVIYIISALIQAFNKAKAFVLYLVKFLIVQIYLLTFISISVVSGRILIGTFFAVLGVIGFICLSTLIDCIVSTNVPRYKDTSTNPGLWKARC